MAGDSGPRDSRVDPRYCVACGTALEAASNYCPTCGTGIDSGPTVERSSAPSSGEGAPPSSGEGTPSSGEGTPPSSGKDDRNRSLPDATPTDGRTGATPTPRTDSAADRTSLEYRIAAATKNGWRLEHDLGDHVVMVRRTLGSVADHLVVAMITVWWTMGLGNVLYAIYRYGNDTERMVLSTDQSTETDVGKVTRSSSFDWAIAAVCWLAGAIVLVTAVQIASIAATLLLGTIAFLLALAGTTRLPSVRDHLEDRRSVTDNGRVRSVEERAVRAPDAPCTACASPIEEGIERTYRSDWCLLGVPLSSSARQNYYCRTCANAEAAPVDSIGRHETAFYDGTEPRAENTDRESESEPNRDRR